MRRGKELSAGFSNRERVVALLYRDRELTVHIFFTLCLFTSTALYLIKVVVATI